MLFARSSKQNEQAKKKNALKTPHWAIQFWIVDVRYVSFVSKLIRVRIERHMRIRVNLRLYCSMWSGVHQQIPPRSFSPTISLSLSLLCSLCVFLSFSLSRPRFYSVEAFNLDCLEILDAIETFRWQWKILQIYQTCRYKILFDW